MRSEFPGLLYCAGTLIAVASWTLFMFSKKSIGKAEQVSILRLSVIWILFLVSSAPALASYPVFEIYSGSMDPDVLDFYSQPFIRLLPAVTLHNESVRIDMLLHGSCQQAQKNRISKHLNHGAREAPWKTSASAGFGRWPSDWP